MNSFFYRKFCPSISNDIELIPAKVPILKLFDNRLRMDIDISTNTPVGSRNTHLLFFYSQVSILDSNLNPAFLLNAFSILDRLARSPSGTNCEGVGQGPRNQ